jgi:DNA-binding CsgD family transcriptional regulator
LIGRLVELKHREAAAFIGTLDRLTAGVFLVDASGRIVHANANARAIVDAGGFLRTVNGRIAARDPVIDQSLRAAFSAAAGRRNESEARGVALPLIAHGGERYLAHVLPLTSGARQHPATVYPAVAALFVRKAALESSSMYEPIAKTYRLTPTELRVLLAIVEVGGVPEVAVALGVAPTTIKTHLSRLFEKTGTRRQADLVKLVAGFNSLVG